MGNTCDPEREDDILEDDIRDRVDHELGALTTRPAADIHE